MTSPSSPAIRDLPGCRTEFRQHIARLAAVGMEGIVLVMVCLSPWAYGAVHPGFELLLFAGVCGLLVLWGARMLLEGQLGWKKCPVTSCLAGLFLIGIWQVTP